MRSQPQLFESRRRTLGRTAPEVERGAQLVTRGGRVSAREALARLGDELLEAFEVELPFADAEQIPGRLRHEAVGTELLPQLRDVDL